MALTEMKCPNCGENMVVETTKGSATCAYCQKSLIFMNPEQMQAPESQEPLVTQTVQEAPKNETVDPRYVGVFTGKVYTAEEVKNVKFDFNDPEDTIECIEEDIEGLSKDLEKARTLLEKHYDEVTAGTGFLKKTFILDSKIEYQSKIIPELEKLLIESELRLIKAKLYNRHYVEE